MGNVNALYEVWRLKDREQRLLERISSVAEHATERERVLDG